MIAIDSSLMPDSGTTADMLFVQLFMILMHYHPSSFLKVNVW
jgi:hypothetical protein